jgi:predicted N-acyltransferase
VYGLYMQTFNRQEIVLEKVPLDFFVHIAANMPDETKYFLWRIEGKIVAFAFCLASKGHFIDYYLGLDYSIAHQYSLYFIRFRDLMKWCIEHGIKEYEMGVTTYEPKRRLGFKFIRLYFYIKHRNKLINPFIRIVVYFIKPERFDPVFGAMQDKANLS